MRNKIKYENPFEDAIGFKRAGEVDPDDVPNFDEFSKQNTKTVTDADDEILQQSSQFEDEDEVPSSMNFYRVAFPTTLVHFVYVTASDEDDAYEKVVSGFELSDDVLDQRNLEDVLTLDHEDVVEYKSQFIKEDDLIDVIITKLDDITVADDDVVQSYYDLYDEVPAQQIPVAPIGYKK